LPILEHNLPRPDGGHHFSANAVFVKDSADRTHLADAILSRILEPTYCHASGMLSATARNAVWRFKMFIKPGERTLKFFMEMSRDLARAA
jgi:hypothetical protein